MSELQYSVKDVANPTSEKIDTKSEETILEGLTEVTVRLKEERKAYDVEFKICRRCGDEVGVSPDGKFRCGRCRNENQDYFGNTTYKLKASKVDEIINRKSAYKCEVCGKVYDVPTKCCIKNYMIERPEHTQRAFWCPKCKSVYAMRVACCDKNPERLVAGTYVRRAV